MEEKSLNKNTIPTCNSAPVFTQGFFLVFCMDFSTQLHNNRCKLGMESMMVNKIQLDALLSFALFSKALLVGGVDKKGVIKRVGAKAVDEKALSRFCQQFRSSYLKDAALAAKAAVVSKAVTAGQTVSQVAIKAIEFATKVKSVLGHALIGGLRAIHSGGKFLTGFITGGLGKLVTFGTNMLAGDSFGQKLVQGLVVATAGGAISALAGGSFELGFITAGVAFAANELVTLATDRQIVKRHDALKKRLLTTHRSDQSLELDLNEADMKVIVEFELYQARKFGEGYYDDSVGGDPSLNDTLLRGELSTASFSVTFGEGTGFSTVGGDINYLGVGASSYHYGVPRLIQNNVFVWGWNRLQYSQTGADHDYRHMNGAGQFWSDVGRRLAGGG